MSYKVEFSNLHIVPESFMAKLLLPLKSSNGTIYNLWVSNAGELYIYSKDIPIGMLFEEADGRYRVKAYEGNDTKLVIPNTYKDKEVTEISSGVFSNNKNIQSIVFPKSLEQINYSAFSGCSSLNDIVLPDGIAEISNFAFENCGGFKDDTIILYSQCNLGDQSFKGAGVKVAVFHDEVSNSGQPFDESLEKLYAHMSQSLENYAFATCSNLRDIYVRWGESDNDSMPSPAPWGAPNATIHFNWNGRIEQ